MSRFISATKVKLTLFGLTLWSWCASCAAQAPLTITGVTNAADLKPGLPQKGSIASIFLTGLDGQGTFANTESPLPLAFRDIAVWVNFVPAPIVSIAFQESGQRINIQVPWELSRDPLYVEVFQGGRRAAFEAPYTNVGFGLMANWSVLFIDANGNALAQHSTDYSLVTPQNPARRGEYVLVYGINLGPDTNTPKTGYAAQSDPLSTFDKSVWGRYVCTASDSVVLQGNLGVPIYVTPAYDGLAPGLVGVYQINFQIPAEAPSGDVSMSVQRTIARVPLGTCSPSQPGFSVTSAQSASAKISIR